MASLLEGSAVSKGKEHLVKAEGEEEFRRREDQVCFYPCVVPGH